MLFFVLISLKGGAILRWSNSQALSDVLFRKKLYGNATVSSFLFYTMPIIGSGQLYQGKYDFLAPRPLLEKAYLNDVLDIPGTMQWLEMCS